MTQCSRSQLRVEELESRETPATLVSPTTVTYQDIDGDNVTVKFSKPILGPNVNPNLIFTFNTNNVNGSNATPQQLRQIFLANTAVAAGTSVSIIANRIAVNGGDGFASVGQIEGGGLDLGTVTVDGDLGRIVAGDATTSTPGLATLNVQSLGRFGTFTGATDLTTTITGKLGTLNVRADIAGAFVNVLGSSDGKLGAVNVGGSLIVNGQTNGGRISTSGDVGSILIKGDLNGSSPGVNASRIDVGGKIAGPVTVNGSLIGGSGNNSGSIEAIGNIGVVKIGGDLRGGANINTGRITSVNGSIASAWIGGSLIGVGGFSAAIQSSAGIGAVTIRGNISGSLGGSGTVQTNGAIASISVGGSLIGGSGQAAGLITAPGGIGSVRIGGSIVGSTGLGTGRIDSSGTVGSITIGGSIYGGTVDFAGSILAGNLGTLRIAGDVVGGSATGTAALGETGSIRAKRIGNLTLGGSLIAGIDNTSGTFINNGAIRVDDDLGTVLIKGSIAGNTTNPAIFSARGKAIPTTTTDIAIGSITVLGRIEFGQILAGFDANGAAENADAQIGPVSVGGDWIASSLVAGAVATNGFFGDGDDAKIAGGNAAIVSKIVSVTIGGQALGTVGGTDHFGIVAENVGVVKVGVATIPTIAGNGNDDFFIGITGDLKVNEI